MPADEMKLCVCGEDAWFGKGEIGKRVCLHCKGAEELPADRKPQTRRGWAELIASQFETDAVDAIEEGISRGEQMTRPSTPPDVVEAPVLAKLLYEAHAKHHGFPGERWNDEPRQSRHSWLNIASAAIAALSASGGQSGMVEQKSWPEIMNTDPVAELARKLDAGSPSPPLSQEGDDD